ncbi:MAG: sigma factor-like helix-turn-helix DNA-binding protein [Armatimonadota bacterium]
MPRSTTGKQSAQAFATEKSLVRRYAPFVKYLVARLDPCLPAQVSRQAMLRCAISALVRTSESCYGVPHDMFERFAKRRIREAIVVYLRGLGVADPCHARLDELAAALFELEDQCEPDATATLANHLNLEADELERRLAEASQFTALPAWALNDGGAEAERQMAEAIREAVAALPERERLIFSLYEEQELTFAEIAQALEVDETAVRLAHATASLRLWAQLPRDLSLSGALPS